jgi:hypothetical protein
MSYESLDISGTETRTLRIACGKMRRDGSEVRKVGLHRVRVTQEILPSSSGGGQNCAPHQNKILKTTPMTSTRA